jgi:aspartyl-tRNA(Asn)/glutamyl-tRNA(Gln) amidotransferase subunit A
MARRVSDVAIMFDAIAGHDPRDATSLTDSTTSAMASLSAGVNGLHIGIDRTYALTGIEPGQAGAIEDALKVLETLGAIIVEVKCPRSTGWSTPGSHYALRKR